jgi:hypothetical protein
MPNSPGQDIHENTGYPPAGFSVEGQGGAIVQEPFQIPGQIQYPPNFVNNPPPQFYHPAQGPPTFFPYQGNPYPPQDPNGLTWQAVQQHDTMFGEYPRGRYSDIEQRGAYVDSPFVGVHGLSTRTQFHPPEPVSQYQVPSNVPGPVDPVPVTYEPSWHDEDSADEDQSRGKRSYRHSIEKLLM